MTSILKLLCLIFGFEREQRFKDVAALIRGAEVLGFDHIWVFDRLFHRTVPVLEPFPVLSRTAAITSRIRLGTMVTILTYRSPFMLTKTVATLGVLSNGKVISGLLLSRNEKELAAGGIDPKKRVRGFADVIKIMKSLWSGETLSYEGAFWRVSEAVEQPRPVVEPHLPNSFAGAAEDALKKAEKYPDGWIAGGMLTPEDVKEKYRIVKESSNKSGGGEKPNLGEIIYISLTENENEVVGNLAICIRRYYGTDIDVRQFAVVGKVYMCKECLKYDTHVVELMILPPIAATSEHIENMWNKVIEG